MTSGNTRPLGIGGKTAVEKSVVGTGLLPEHGILPFFVLLSVVASVGCSLLKYGCHLLLITQILYFFLLCIPTLLVVLSRALVRALAGYNRFLHISAQKTKDLSVVSWGLRSLNIWAYSVRSLTCLIGCSESYLSSAYEKTPSAQREPRFSLKLSA